MRIRKHFATDATPTIAVAMILAMRGDGSSTTTSTGDSLEVSDGPKGTTTAGVTYETTDYGPVTTLAPGMGANWRVLEGLYCFNTVDCPVSPTLTVGDSEKISDIEYEVKLRGSAKFSGSTPVTTVDSAVPCGRAISGKLIYRQFFTFVDSVGAKDDNTTTIKLKHLFANLKERSVNICVVPASTNEDSPRAKPISTGFYKYENITVTKIIAVPSEDYIDSEPTKVIILK